MIKEVCLLIHVSFPSISRRILIRSFLLCSDISFRSQTGSQFIAGAQQGAGVEIDVESITYLIN